MAGLFDHPTTPALRKVLEEVAAGEICIPDFQRPFVWKNEQRLRLIDSVAQGLPIGALLVWRSHKRRLRSYETLGPFRLPPQKEEGPWTYVIDGHQRLTTLFAALTPYDSASFDETVDGRWPLYVDLTESPPAFTLQARGGPRPTLVPSNLLLRNKLVYAQQQRLWEQGLDREADALERLADQFKDYHIPVIPMVSEDISVVTRAFARVNTGGTTMSEAHLAAALAYDRVPLREALADLEEHAAELGWPAIDQGAILNGLKFRFDLDVYRGHIDELLRALGTDSGSEDKLFAELRDYKGWLERAFDVLQAVGLHGSGALPYRYQALLLAEGLRRAQHADRQEVERRAERWFWQSTFTEAFTGATGRQLRQALDALVAYLEGAAPAPHDGVAVRVEARHRRWGSVRSAGRMLALAQATGRPDPLVWLGRLGNGAVHKLLPSLDPKRPSSWVVAEPETLALARSALHGDHLAMPLDVARQIDREAFGALLAGAFETFADLQDAHILAVERAQITAVGLVAEPAPESP